MLNEKKRVVAWVSFVILCLLLPGSIEAKALFVNTRAAILIDISNDKVLFEKNVDVPIAPASVTKILTLYIVFDAIREGRLHPQERVKISNRAASTGGSRMSLRAGQEVPVEEIVKGIAVVSGNDAAVAIAEHMSGSVEEFVWLMNRKARELGMVNSLFMTPNGLPAQGQVSTARDLAKLSLAYLHRFPDSLTIHSMRSYSFNRATHRNANRLLATCPGVDGIKTGFVCASGYNISATAKRGDTRLLAVVLGASSSGIRAAETAKLLEMGFQMTCPGCPEPSMIASAEARTEREASVSASRSRGRTASVKKSVSVGKRAKTGATRKTSVAKSGKKTSKTVALKASNPKEKTVSNKKEIPEVKSAAPKQSETAVKVATSSKKSRSVSKSDQKTQEAPVKTVSASAKGISSKQAAPENQKSAKAAAKEGSKKQAGVASANQSKKQNQAIPAAKEKIQKSGPQLQDSKQKKG